MTLPYRLLTAVLAFTTKYDRWTRQELALGTGMSRAAAERLVAELHKRRVIRIDAWSEDARGRASIAIFTRGSAPDAKRRPALTGRARTAAYKTRQSALLQGVMNQWRKPHASESQDRLPLSEAALHDAHAYELRGVAPGNES